MWKHASSAPVRVSKRRPALPSALPPKTLALSPEPLYACLYRPPAPDDRGPERPAVQPGGCRAGLSGPPSLIAIAQEFSPRYEQHRGDLVSVDVSGLTRLLGPARTIGEEMRREAAARGMRVHVAVAGTRMAALLLAQARPGLTVIAKGEEATALASLPIGILTTLNS